MLITYLTEFLGTTLIAHVTAVDATTVRRWTKDETAPSAEAEQRLRATAQVARLLLSADSADTLRAWFIGLNPQLDDEAPIDALAAGKDREVLAAAHAFLDGA